VFYIYVSELAAHTKNMLHNNRVSVLFIMPESETQNLFARERIVFDCTISEIQQDDEIYETQLQAMQEKFGETVALLRNLTDFYLLALTPVTGKYIAGFGKAFEINIEKGQLKLAHQQKK
jgi:putative heme iron utilization protein